MTRIYRQECGLASAKLVANGRGVQYAGQAYRAAPPGGAEGDSDFLEDERTTDHAYGDDSGDTCGYDGKCVLV